MTLAVQQGLPQAAIQEAAAKRQARLDRGLDILVGVNRYVSDEEESVDIRSIDNTRVRTEQVERLQKIRATRDTGLLDGCLERLVQVARSERGNLLEASIAAMRARATVGEVSEALEQVFGRFQAAHQGITGVYGSFFQDDPSWQGMKLEVEQFARVHGRQPRLLVAKLGQDGHDRGAKVIAAGLSDLGFDVDLGPLFQTPAEVARAAVDHDVHLLGISTQAGAHLTLVAELMHELARLGGGDIIVVCGGVIPRQDQTTLLQAGVASIFEPGSSLPNVARELLSLLKGVLTHDAG
jgi:methylmalonyl-CoA mutase